MKALVKATSTLALGFGLLVASPAEADMSAEMNQLFDSYSATTAPTYVKTQRRGALSGGRFSLKNRLMDENLISVSPPGFRAGCGGIDMWGGSFSYINAEQFTQLLRQIAANSVGYLFKIALSTMCETCDDIMSSLQKLMQELNSLNANSCQLAQGIVNDTLGSFDIKGKTDASFIAQIEGGASDFMAALRPIGGETPADKAKSVSEAEYKEKVSGNLVWKALKKNGVDAWFPNGDDALLYTIMNMTGTIIVGDEETLPNGEKAPKITIKQPILNFRDFFQGTGTNHTIYQCTDGDGANECLEMAKTLNVTLEPFENKMLKKFLGDGTTVGIVEKLATNQELEEEEASFLSASPSNALIYRLVAHGESVMSIYVRENIKRLAFDMAYLIAKESLKSVRISLGTIDNAYLSQANNLLRDSTDAMQQDMQVLMKDVPATKEIVELYVGLMRVIRRNAS